MADPNQNQPANDKSQIPQERPIPENIPDNAQQNQIDSSATSQACKYEPQMPPNIIIQRDQPDDIQPRRANNIANRMFFASIISSIISFGVLWATYYIWQATKSSVEVANQALTIDRAKDSVSMIRDSISEKRQDSMFQVNRTDIQNRFRLDSNSSAQQIRDLQLTLDETKQEFKIQNEPYIQVNPSSIRLAIDSTNKAISISYSLVNLKDIICKVILTDVGFMPYALRPNFDSAKAKMRLSLDTGTANVNQFITKESPITVDAFPILNRNDLAWCSQPGHHLYVMASAKFQNLITLKYRYSYVTLRITFVPENKPHVKVITEILNNEIE